MTQATAPPAPTSSGWEPVVAVGVSVVAVGLVATGLSLSGAASELDDQLLLLEATVAGAAGFVILSARPGHPIGRLLNVAAFLDGFMELTTGYVDWAFATDPIRGGGLAMRALREYGWPPPLLVFGSILLRFPTGHPLTPRWRTFEHVLWGWLGLWAITIVTPWQFTDHPRVNGMPNPLGLGSLEPSVGTIHVAVNVTLLGLTLAAVGSVIVRFRRARGDERQQIKWLLYFVSPMLLLVVILPTWETAELSRGAFGVITIMLITGITVGALRFRLYDVDLVIRRTVTYATVSGVLVGAYAVGVTAMAPLLRPVTDGAALSVAISTLAVVALFNPVRRRIQEVVDRRFNRARFDAAQTIAEFSHRLRDEVDVQRLRDEFALVTGNTMQPAHVAVWLRGTRAQP